MSLIEAIRRAQVIDASPAIRTGMPIFPGHPAVKVDGQARTHERDGYFLQTLFIGEHAGTHADAPAHVLAGGKQTIDAIPAGRFVAPYLILDLSGLGLGPGDLATESDVRAAERQTGHPLEQGDAALVHFGWDDHYLDAGGTWWAANAPGLAEDACTYLVDRGVGLVGSDTATCDTAVVDGVIVCDVGHTSSISCRTDPDRREPDRPRRRAGARAVHRAATQDRGRLGLAYPRRARRRGGTHEDREGRVIVCCPGRNFVTLKLTPTTASPASATPP